MIEAQPGGEVTVYWRPGCGFCSSLLRQLEHHAVPHRRVNIWDEPEAAAIVRSIARGNETVPTVTIGAVGLVNPSVHELLAIAAEHAPHVVPADYQAPQGSRFGRWVHDKLGG